MEVKVLAFGIAKEIFGGTSTTLELPGSTNAKELRDALEQQYPRLKELASYMVAVNDEYAEDDIVIGIQDEIAIIPPVSGG